MRPDHGPNMRGALWLSLAGTLSTMACGLLTAGPLPTPAPPPALLVELWAELPVARVGDRQVLHVQVFDLSGQPVNGVNVLAEVTSPYARSSFVFPVTDASGRALYQEIVPDAAPGTLFEVRARAFRYLAAGEAETSFTVWP